MARIKQPLCKINIACGVIGKRSLRRKNAAQYWYWIDGDEIHLEAIARTAYGVDISSRPNSLAMECCGACREVIANR